MNISAFFRELRSSYQSEMDDMAFDSEGRHVLQQRLAERRKELGFLLQMMELSPEMVAVVFHQGFNFKSPAVMDHLLTHQPHEFPHWDSLADAIHLPTWAHDLSQVVLKEPMRAWFLSVAAGLEYMYSRPAAATGDVHDDGQDTEDGDDVGDGNDTFTESDDSDHGDVRAREEAGADWMVEQGFDRKD